MDNLQKHNSIITSMTFKSDKKEQFYTAKTDRYHYKISTVLGSYRAYVMKDGIGTQISIFENLEDAKQGCIEHYENL